MIKILNAFIKLNIIRAICLGSLSSCTIFYSVDMYAAAAVPQPLIQSKLPILTISQHSPQQMGLEIGEKSKYIFPDIERRYDTHLAQILTQTHFDYLLKNQLPLLMSQVDEAYKSEMKGVTAAWSIIQNNTLGDGFLSMDEYLILNLLPSMGFAPNGSGFAAFKYAAQNKHSIVGRNMDWKSTPELRSLQAITVYHSQDQSLVNIGFLGIVSILTGFNQHGLFLSYFNAEPYTPYSHRYKSNPVSKKIQSNIFSLRKTLEDSDNIQKASQSLSRKMYSQANNILIADKTKSEVLEYAPNHRVKTRHWKSATHNNKPWSAKQQIAVIDCNVLASLPNNCKESKDNYHWHRLAQLAKFNPQHPAQERNISALLLDTKNDGHEIFNAQTLSSIIFIPQSNALYLYAAPVEINNNTQAIHLAYLDLLPVSKGESSNNNRYSLQLIWFTLLLLLLIIVWIYKIPAKILKKCK